ncbi:hypothetical protein COO91_04894 [Nostoc flagelliforme CCNUN1]|uniref:Uncharacterized protein n=1 Tax=Nostoc flagelliforme CCNUN1 TaxID=2038116 RepID=A0A2K8SVX8_9NOSO|nr:hypothetical protein COO91_04894 [Nostoc flagelliforme CCNUN1]
MLARKPNTSYDYDRFIIAMSTMVTKLVKVRATPTHHQRYRRSFYGIH